MARTHPPYDLQVEVLLDAVIPGVTSPFAAPLLQGVVRSPRWPCAPSVAVVVAATGVVPIRVGVVVLDAESDPLVSVATAIRLLTGIQSLDKWAREIAVEAAAQRAREIWTRWLEKDTDAPVGADGLTELVADIFARAAEKKMSRSRYAPDDDDLARAAELWRQHDAGELTAKQVANQLRVSLRTAYRRRDQIKAAGLLAPAPPPAPTESEE